MKSNYVAAKVRDVPALAEGRVFLLKSSEWSAGQLVPGSLKDHEIQCDGKLCELKIADPEMPNICHWIKSKLGMKNGSKSRKPKGSPMT